MMNDVYSYRARVLRIVDSNVVEVEVDLGFKIYHKVQLRLAGIKTPDMNSKNQRTRKMVMGFLVQRILGKLVEIDVCGEDRNGQYLAYIYDSNGEVNINWLLVEEGFAALPK
jgi:micrococcal nuclease